MSKALQSSRRKFLKATAATAAGVALPAWRVGRGAPAIIAANSERPQALQGLHFGDPSNGSVVVWSRSDRPARMLVDWSYDEDFRDVLRTALRRAFPSADVECVADGQAALEALEFEPASVALIDLRMPVLDGVALTAALRQRESSARMPIIVLTGRGGAREWQALSSMGADRFLVKPVNLDDVVTLIRRSLREALAAPVPRVG